MGPRWGAEEAGAGSTRERAEEEAEFAKQTHWQIGGGLYPLSETRLQESLTCLRGRLNDRT